MTNKDIRGEFSWSERIMLKTHARIHLFFSCQEKRQENTGGRENLKAIKKKKKLYQYTN